jgi:hypothetical protein
LEEVRICSILSFLAVDGSHARDPRRALLEPILKARRVGIDSYDFDQLCRERVVAGFRSESAVYSMAHILKHPELPPVILFRQEDVGRYVSREQLDVFMSHQLAAQRKKDDG